MSGAPHPPAGGAYTAGKGSADAGPFLCALSFFVEGRPRVRRPLYCRMTKTKGLPAAGSGESGARVRVGPAGCERRPAPDSELLQGSAPFP